MPSNPALAQAVSLHQSGRLAEAEAAYRQILKAGKNPNAEHMLGLAVFQQGRVRDAAKILHRVTRSYPDFAEAHYNLGVVQLQIGKITDAARAFKQALKQAPAHEAALNNLANTYIALGRFSDAEAPLRQAVEMSPDNADAWHQLGVSLHHQEKRTDAFAAHRRAVDLAGENPVFWNAWAHSTIGLAFDAADTPLQEDLARLLTQPSIQPDCVVPAIESALRHTAAAPLFVATAPLPDATDAATFADIPLLLTLLENTIIAKPETERALTHLRGGLLAKGCDDVALPFVAALALYCFHTDYAFFEADDETAQIISLQARVENEKAASPTDVAILALYRPLSSLGNAEALGAQSWPTPMMTLIHGQISAPLKERKIRRDIPAITPINDDVSAKVREQYEESPYPQWVTPSRFPMAKPVETVLRSTSLDLDGVTSFPTAPDILIAGCGTGRHALRTASEFADSTLLAVDLSLTSLSYAVRKSKELDAKTVSYAQADILELGALDRQFDIIESAGVLHHMNDPIAGWRVLTGLLKPGGFMRIALYSELARAVIVRMRDTIAEQGITPTPDGIRQFRHDILERDDNPADMKDLLTSRDFYTLSDCRDLLFHAQEHRFTIPQIEQAIQDLGLDFLGFDVAPSVAHAFTKKNKKKRALSSLPLWHRFETEHPETFRGMYQFWCRKK